MDEAFKKAIDVLGSYERKFHPRREVKVRMADAMKKDIFYSTFLGTLRETFSLKVRLGRIQLRHLMNNVTDNKQPQPTKLVEFRLVRSLPVADPIIVNREHQICLQY